MCCRVGATRSSTETSRTTGAKNTSAKRGRSEGGPHSRRCCAQGRPRASLAQQPGTAPPRRARCAPNACPDPSAKVARLPVGTERPEVLSFAPIGSAATEHRFTG
jgi:hypothetical protein